MKLPATKRILREDLRDAPGWVNGIIGPVNSFMESVYQSLNHNISLTDNIASFVKEITYKTNSTYPTGMAQITFRNELKTKPIGVVVLQVYNRADYTPAPGPVYVPWVENVGDIVVSTITGLEADRNYMIRLAVF